MKKLFSLLVATMLVFSLAGCKKKVDKTQKVDIDYSSLEGILTGIEEDIDVTEKEIKDKLEEKKKDIENLSDWYDFAETETENLYKRTQKNAAEYYKLVAKQKNNPNPLDCYNALEEFKERIFDRALPGYKTEVLSRCFGDLEDFLSEFSETSGLSRYSLPGQPEDHYADFEKLFSDADTAIHDNHYKIRSEFAGKNFNVDEILK